MFPNRENKNPENEIDYQLVDILHPSKFVQNFSVLSSFENYLRGFCASYKWSVLIPTFKEVLKAYEEWEGYEQCQILKTILEEITMKTNTHNG